LKPINTASKNKSTYTPSHNNNPTQIIETLTTKNIAHVYEKTKNPNQQIP